MHCHYMLVSCLRVTNPGLMPSSVKLSNAACVTHSSTLTTWHLLLTNVCSVIHPAKPTAYFTFFHHNVTFAPLPRTLKDWKMLNATIKFQDFYKQSDGPPKKHNAKPHGPYSWIDTEPLLCNWQFAVITTERLVAADEAPLNAASEWEFDLLSSVWRSQALLSSVDTKSAYTFQFYVMLLSKNWCKQITGYALQAINY